MLDAGLIPVTDSPVGLQSLSSILPPPAFLFLLPLPVSSKSPSSTPERIPRMEGKIEFSLMGEGRQEFELVLTQFSARDGGRGKAEDT